MTPKEKIREILLRYHGRLNLLTVEDKDWKELIKYLKAEGGNGLQQLIETERHIYLSNRSKKAMQSRPADHFIVMNEKKKEKKVIHTP